MRMLRTLALWGTLGLMLPAMACLAAGEPPLRIATDANYPPFEFRDAHGQIQGFDIDIGNELCRRLERECDWHDLPFDRLIPGLRMQQFELINSSMMATQARRRDVDFSHSIYRVPLRLVSRKGSGLQPTVESLRGRRVGVQRGSAMEAYVNGHWAPAGVTVVTFASYTEAYIALMAGRLDATLQDAQSALAGFLNESEGRDYALSSTALFDPSLNAPVALGVRQGDDALRQAVNDALAAMRSDGTLHRLVQRYFPTGGIELSE